MAFKWVVLLAGHRIHYPKIQAINVYCAASIYGLFLPTTLGADAMRAFIVAKKGYPANPIIASIVVERMIGFIASLLMGLTGWFILYQSQLLDQRFDPIWNSIGLIIGLGLAAFALSFSRRLFNGLFYFLPDKLARSKVALRLKSLHETYISFHAEKKVLLVFFLLTLVEQLLPVLGMFLIAFSVGADVSLIFMAGVVPLTLLISRIPISVEGLGVFEAIFATLMALGGIPAAEALTIVVISRILGILVLIPWWLAYAWQNGSMKPPATPHNPTQHPK